MTNQRPAYKIAAGWGLTNAKVGALDADGKLVGELIDPPVPSSIMLNGSSGGQTFDFIPPPTWEIVSGASSVTWVFNPRNRKQWRRWLRFFLGEMPNRHKLHNIERRATRARRRADRGF